jgi:2-octaprenyl-6-methoxyphenol hydroxylase
MNRIVVEDNTLMNTSTYDIVISGAGPVGSALALMLAHASSSPSRIALVGTAFNQQTQHGSHDPRTLALNHGSQALLEQLGAWPGSASPIRAVHVSQRGRLGRTLITPGELGVGQLGSVVGYDALLGSLHKAIDRSGVTLIQARPARKLLADSLEFTDDAQRFTGRLCVQSDGERPQGVIRQYNQHAVLVTVQASQPRDGWAFERFTNEGPLAILPHPSGSAMYGVVWCCSTDTARMLEQLSLEDFAGALNQKFGTRLGWLQPQGTRHVYPLTMHAGPARINARTVAIGNAAQTLHPVAGQGLNLGLRDAAQLAQALIPWLDTPEQPPDAVLQDYAQKRSTDRWLTGAITDTLPRIFTTRRAWVEHACGLALLGMDTLSALRKPLAHQLLHGLRL